MHSVQRIREAFARTGLRRTPQRYAVLEYLLRCTDHPTAEQISLAINARDPRASRATVYNNLHSLIEAGLVREVVVEAGPVRYDANLDHHHHFLCERCGGLEDIGDFEIPGLSARASLNGRLVRDFEIVFRGFCRQCSTGTKTHRRNSPHGKSS